MCFEAIAKCMHTDRHMNKKDTIHIPPPGFISLIPPEVGQLPLDEYISGNEIFVSHIVGCPLLACS